MIEKNIEELSFVIKGGPIPSVEIDIDSIPSNFSGYDDIVIKALNGIITKNLSVRATIYVYRTISINFLDQTNSAFFGVAGPKSVLRHLCNAFQRIPGLRVRYSDYISPSESICQYHVQDGKVWQPIDALTWFATLKEPKGSSEQHTISAKQDDEEVGFPPDTTLDKASSNDPTTPRTENVSRFRSARSDASLRSVKQTIEEVFGLPEGCVALCGPDGKALRSDAKVSTLRKRWE